MRCTSASPTRRYASARPPRPTAISTSPTSSRRPRSPGPTRSHPGYGFLSENARFAEIVEAHGLIWIGPKPEHIRTMGDKVEAKRTAGALGLPLVPGSDGPITDLDAAKAVAAEIGYPVLIKAASGGGGRGMKVVASEDLLEELIANARQEAKAAFGDDTVYMEKYLGNPRHIEFRYSATARAMRSIWASATARSSAATRRCWKRRPPPSSRRRSARRPGDIVARAMADMAYRGAGTIEFLYEDGQFYFIEMNTRLQVEHPVTEAITGLDLVREQIRVAEGQPLTLRQEDVGLPRPCDRMPHQCRGSAQLRAVARAGEAISRARRHERARRDSGLYAGYRIPPYYDSMIAKLIVYGTTRAGALRRLRRALEEFVVDGGEDHHPPPPGAPPRSGVPGRRLFDQVAGGMAGEAGHGIISSGS